MLGEGPTDDINGSVGTAEKKFSINFSKAKTKYCLSLYYNVDERYLFLNGEKSINLNPIRKYKFLTQYCLGSISKKFHYIESEVLSFIISVDYNAIYKF